MRRVLIALASAALLAAATAPSAWAVNPSTGVYQGIIDGSSNTNGHNEGEGYFRLKSTSNGDKIVPANCCGYALTYIVAPNNIFGGDPVFPHCDPYNANLVDTKIPVSGGAFDYRGKAKGPTTNYPIHFKGSWASSTKVTGYTRLKSNDGTCDTGKMPWTMRTPPPG